MIESVWGRGWGEVDPFVLGSLPPYIADAVHQTGVETIIDFAHFWSSETALSADVIASGYTDSEVSYLVDVWKFARSLAMDSVEAAA